ncbi:MAG: DUF1559 domain-containing protein, partial [Thermoguttaceae bacterium]
ANTVNSSGGYVPNSSTSPPWGAGPQPSNWSPVTQVANTDPAFFNFDNWTGLNHQRSRVTNMEITDGASNTYLVGEKYLSPDSYLSGKDPGDGVSILSGADYDLHRWTTYSASTPTAYSPLRDRRGVTAYMIFGSAHASGFNMALCDGSVRTINFNIDPQLHSNLGCRNDRNTIDPSGF